VRVLEAKEIAHLPGTNGDALHAVENLPGVARTNGLTGDLAVRGSAPGDSAVFLDGTYIPFAFHLGGITSIVPSETIERLDFHPGNFSPEQGRLMGGIIDLGLRSPRKDRWGGLAQVDLLDARVLAEGPLSDSTRVLVAARRSWIDAWIGPVLRSMGAGVSTAPVYYDGQAMLEHDFSSKTTARLLFLGSDDRLALSVPSPASGNPALGGDVGAKASFLRVQGRLDTRFSDAVRWTNMASWGIDDQSIHIGTNTFDARYHLIDARSDVRARLSRAVTLVTGIDTLTGFYDVSLQAPPRVPDGSIGGPTFGVPNAVLAASGVATRPAAYAMLDLRPVDPLTILPGVRADYSSEIKDLTVDPRLNVRLDVASGPRTTLKGGAGAYHQVPEPSQSIAPFGTPTLRSNVAYHYSLGVEQEIGREVEISAEGFYKDFRDLVVNHAGATPSGSVFDNAGSGRAYGTEILVRWKPGGRFFGWLAYTLSRSERRTGDGNALTLFDFDQTHILNAIASYSLGRGWTLGARWRYVTGVPYTPITGAVVDLDAGAYAPTTSQQINSARVGPYHSLDVRVDKTWTFDAWRLTAYADVRNVYDRPNPEAINYDYRYRSSSPVSGLPILPIIGVRGEL
jgi:hypothetical protein